MKVEIKQMETNGYSHNKFFGNENGNVWSSILNERKNAILFKLEKRDRSEGFFNLENVKNHPITIIIIPFSLQSRQFMIRFERAFA